jgi:hypothetical protein
MPSTKRQMKMINPTAEDFFERPKKVKFTVPSLDCVMNAATLPPALAKQLFGYMDWAKC